MKPCSCETGKYIGSSWCLSYCSNFRKIKEVKDSYFIECEEDYKETQYSLLEGWENLKYRMEKEGFHYCFTSYSSFEEIKDEELHKLRKSYLEITKKLEDHINTKVDELRNNV